MKTTQTRNRARDALRCLTAALVIGAASAYAQTGPVNAPSNVVQLSATGTLEAQQDWLTVSLTTTREGTDPSSVQTALRQTLDTALLELKKSAQPGGMDVRSGAFNLRPRYSNDGKINGWIGSAELVLEGSDFARIGTAAARAQPMVIGGLNFSLSRQARSKLETQAQAQAIASFRVRAKEIAQGFGFNDYSLREVSVGSADQPVYPVPRMMAMSAKSIASEASVPMESGKTLVVVTVSGSVQLK